MEFRSVVSSNLRGVAYDKDSTTMVVEFISGSKYAYTGVPEDEYESLLSAPSPGSYFAENIKDSYPYQRV
jgi:hypothetical protein